MISKVLVWEKCIWRSQRIIQNNSGDHRSLSSGCPALSISMRKSSGEVVGDLNHLLGRFHKDHNLKAITSWS